MGDLITRILLAITKRVPLPGKLKWKVGMRDEIAFWDGHMARHFLTTNPGGLSGEAIFRLDKKAPLQDKFTELLKDCTADPHTRCRLWAIFIDREDHARHNN